MQSRSGGVRSAWASAFSEASFARLAPVSPFATQARVWMPLRWTIHSSEVSIIRARSSLLTRREGTWKPVAMNSVRDIRAFRTSRIPPDRGCGIGGTGEDFAPAPPKQGSHGSREHPPAVRRHRPRPAPPGRPQGGARSREDVGRRRRAPPHVRGGDRPPGAVRLERPYGRGGQRAGGPPGTRPVRRPPPPHPPPLTTPSDRAVSSG